MSVAYQGLNYILCGTCGSGMTVQSDNGSYSQYVVWCTNPSCAENGVHFIATAPSITLTPSS